MKKLFNIVLFALCFACSFAAVAHVSPTVNVEQVDTKVPSANDASN